MDGETVTSEGSVLGHLRAAATEHADRIALSTDGRHLSYRELHAEVDGVGGALLEELGEGPEAVVLVCRSGWGLVRGALGAIRAARPFVVLDGRDPRSRLQFVVEDARTSAVLADEGALEAARSVAGGRPVLELDRAAHTRTQPWLPRTPGDRPFSISYTSGSTGEPKGVVRTNASATRNLLSSRGRIPKDSRAGLLWSATAGLTGVQLLGPLSGGATLCPFDLRAHGVEALADWLVTERVSEVFLVPTILRRLLETLPDGLLLENVRRLQSGGEPLFWRDVTRLRRHLRPDAEVVCSYGSAEAGSIARYTVPHTAQDRDGVVPVGHPVGDKRLHLVDASGAPVPPGSVGEVLVESRTLADGYFDRPEQTRDRFRPTPTGTRVLHTGDLGRLDQNGCLELVGREDGMVKVSGHRVEPAEIESTLARLPQIAEAAVVVAARPDRGHRVNAYVVAAGAREIDPARLRQQLAEHLPLHMLPASIIPVRHLPLLHTGKVDQRALRDLQSSTAARADGVADTEAHGDLERALARLWSEVLDLGEEAGLHDDFFEFGGGSLQAATLFARVERELGHDLDLSLLLEAPTVASLADAIRSDHRAGSPPVLVPVQPGGEEPPLFVVHAAYGTVLIYRDLARHLDDRPVHGLQSPALGGGPLPGGTIESLAARYVAELRLVQPHGPYHLLGHSMGGAVAFEMARQLVAGGDQVAFLGIGDLPCPVREPGRRLSLTWWDRQARFTRTRTDGGGPYLVVRKAAGQLWWRTSQRVRQARARWHVRRGVPSPRHLRDAWLWDVHTRALRAYRPQPYPGRVTLLRSRDPVDDPTLGWTPYAPSGLDVVQLEGWHDQIWREPHVAVNADRVKRALSTATAR